MLLITSPMPARLTRSGPFSTKSRSTITAIGMCTPYEPLMPSLIRLATGEAMPSLARLVATDTIGSAQRVAAYFAVSIVLPPPMPTTASYDRARSFAGQLERRVQRAAGGGEDVGRAQRRPDQLGDPLALTGADHHRHVTAGRDPAVGEDPAEVRDRAAAYVDVQRRLDATG